ncbi:ABC transporter G family member 1-like [Corylus avellana]|uniref:ABC transporter G family member 1-like n=1 Tax=Corylus avellana TaxID=13451 RepID=UPI00286A67F0|nr:ABC transporter G family member 1-like [Corylus avellana]
MASLFPSTPHPNTDPEINVALEIETGNPVQNKRDVDAFKTATVQRRSEDGVFLTWEDLYVTVSNGKNGTKVILQGLTGHARPGELLAIMGPSGCGKSTLLDALAGRLGSNIRQTGEILINGRKQVLAYGTSAYVTQDDTLMMTLTVREAVYYSAQLQLPDSMTKSEKKERADTTMREMGLQESVNTRIGGWGVKGISGGQKRRVSICMEMLTRPKLLFLDEPTSGLDSAALYYVMSGIARLSQRDGVRRTIVASIHQPSSEVFQLFHHLCLLSSGKTVYFGPASEANEFFALSGFPCSTLQNPSDHYLKTINKDFDKDIEEGVPGAISAEEAIEILIRSYESTGRRQQVTKEVAEIRKQSYGEMERKRKRASFINQCLVLTKRSFVNMFRDLGYYWLRLAIYIALAVGLGTVFYNIGDGDGSVQARGSLVTFIASFLTFMAIGGFPSFVEDMKIFERERLNGHYGATAFVISNTLSALPYLVLVSVIPGAIAYFLPGLRSGLQFFLYFALVLFASMVLVESLMMIVASIVPNYLMGIITGAGIQGLMILVGGFFRLPNDLPKPLWKYPLHEIAFHKYAYQGMFKNEFGGKMFPNHQNGDDILRNTWHAEMGYSKWGDLAVLLGMIAFYRLLFLGIVKGTEKFKPLMIKAFMSKKNTQVMMNPSSTPLHGGKL